MSEENKRLLETLGFKLVTGTIWRHELTNESFCFDDDIKTNEIVGIILQRGALLQNALIKKTLGISN